MRSDNGRTWRLELSRTPVDQIEKRVRIIGTVAEEVVVIVEAIALA